MTIASISNATPLAVELSDFNIACSEIGGVNIAWKTSSELNNSHFVIERSRDGVVFEQVMMIEDEEADFTYGLVNKV